MISAKRNVVLFTLILTGCMCGYLFAAPVLSGIQIISGPRGTILSLTADVEFQCSVNSDDPMKVSIFIPGCVYGIKEFSYSKFEKKSPIAAMKVLERKDGAGIELLISMKSKTEKNITAKRKGVQQLILLSRKPEADFSWSTVSSLVAEGKIETDKYSNESKQPQKEEKNKVVTITEAKPVQNKQVPINIQKKPLDSIYSYAGLKDISMLRRGYVCKLVFEFDRKIAGGVRRNGDSLIIVFSGAENKIGKRVFDVKPEAIFRKIILSGDTVKKDLRAIVVLNSSSSNLKYNVTHQDKRILSVYMLHKDELRTALWTAKSGTKWDHEFTYLSYTEPDLKELGKRAIYDSSVKIKTGSVFRVGDLKKDTVKIVENVPPVDTVKKHEVKEMVPQEEKTVVENREVDKLQDRILLPNDTVIFTVDNLNIRAIPENNGAIIGKGNLKSKVVRIKSESGWTNVYVNGMDGWVSSRFVKDKFQNIKLLANENGDVIDESQTDTVKSKRVLLSAVSNDSIAIKKVSLQNVIIIDSLLENQKKEIVDKIVRYNASGRDPFKPLGRDSTCSDGRVVVENLALVGLLFDGQEKIALFEDKLNKRRPFTLKEDDRVENGKVLRIYRDKVVFLLTELGISRSFTMKLNGNEFEQEARGR